MKITRNALHTHTHTQTKLYIFDLTLYFEIHMGAAKKTKAENHRRYGISPIANVSENSWRKMRRKKEIWLRQTVRKICHALFTIKPWMLHSYSDVYIFA